MKFTNLFAFVDSIQRVENFSFIFVHLVKLLSQFLSQTRELPLFSHAGADPLYVSLDFFVKRKNESAALAT